MAASYSDIPQAWKLPIHPNLTICTAEEVRRAYGKRLDVEDHVDTYRVSHRAVAPFAAQLPTAYPTAVDMAEGTGNNANKLSIRLVAGREDARNAIFYDEQELVKISVAGYLGISALEMASVTFSPPAITICTIYLDYIHKAKLEKVISQVAARFDKPIPLKSLDRDTTGPRSRAAHGKTVPWGKFLDWQVKYSPDDSARLIAHARALGLFESGALPEEPPYFIRTEHESKRPQTRNR